MRKLTIVALSLVLTLAVVSGVCATTAVDILVSPQTLLLDAEQGGSITVHAEIAYSKVNSASLTLNGVPVDFTFSDSRGELVAKFSEDAVKDIVAPPRATLTLWGETVDGEPFSGSDVVRVVKYPRLP